MRVHDRLGRWSIVGAVAVSLVVGSAGAVSAKAMGPTGISAPTVAVGVFRGAIKGIVVASENDLPDGRLRLSLSGLPKSGTMRLVGSTKACTKSHSPADRVLGWSWGLSQTGGFAADRPVDGLFDGPVDAMRSLRLFKGSSQKACTKAHPHEPGGTTSTTALELENTLVTSYVKAPGPRGLILTRLTDEHTVGVTLSFLALAGGQPYRLVGSSMACGSPHTRSARVFSVSISQHTQTAAGFDAFIEIDGVAAKAPGALRSWRLFRGPGTSDQVECKGIIAILIGL
jgi:hypothetical protein